MSRFEKEALLNSSWTKVWDEKKRGGLGGRAGRASIKVAGVLSS